jgi:hypothetical protein
MYSDAPFIIEKCLPSGNFTIVLILFLSDEKEASNTFSALSRWLRTPTPHF